MRVLRYMAAVVLCLCLHTGRAATLEQLSLPELVEHATLIVRARPTTIAAIQNGAIIYTLHSLRVSEVLHGRLPGRNLELALPGGRLGDRSQTFSGVPAPAAGQEYVFFLWRGRNGLYQLVGLNQGMLEVSGNTAGAVASRPPIEGTMLNRRTGLPVRDEGLRLTLRQLRSEVALRASNSGDTP
jgi:hypothetical protein